MTKTVRILALVMALVTVACLFVSCGPISGTYAAEDEELKFMGKNVTYTMKLSEDSTVVLKGTYEINDDKITFTFDADKSEGDGIDEVVSWMNAIAKDIDFEKGDGYIKIGETKYEKK